MMSIWHALKGLHQPAGSPGVSSARPIHSNPVSRPAHFSPSLLPSLQPVRLCLQPYLSDIDAARLLCTSRSVATSLLPGFAFVDHVFTGDTAEDVKRAIALYGRYNMRILRLCTVGAWPEPLVDSETGRSVLPASLLALTVGAPDKRPVAGPQRVAAGAALDGSVGSLIERRGVAARKVSKSDEQLDFQRRIRPVDVTRVDDRSWSVLRFSTSCGGFDQPILPGALPLGLRLLQLDHHSKEPLQPGSIPDSVSLLQVGGHFNQPLVGLLPSSLTHLVLGDRFNQPLSPDVLPAGLLRLRLGNDWNYPLTPGTLPTRLQHLTLGYAFDQSLAPGVIPPSVTHLRLDGYFDQPLYNGSLPPALVHLNLGERFDQPLSPGVLPSSLRQLAISKHFDQRLHPGSLPDGLELLSWHEESAYVHVLEPGIVPASVQLISMGQYYRQRLEAGGIPATVKQLRLPKRYAKQNLSDVLASSTAVVWWKGGNGGLRRWNA